MLVSNDLKQQFKSWLIEENRRVEAKYRQLLIKEISVSLRIMGKDNLHEFKPLLHKSLKEIKVPPYNNPPFNLSRDIMNTIFDENDNPNFKQVMLNVMVEYEVN